ncbi:MAG TPA: SRPBCC family protein [Bryobacteraceae bacterium]|nr:SRPBCC family protein [Bryobacteraceae bacterium]
MMPELSVTHSTFVIERHYPATPERVFRAFSDPAKKRRWLGEGEGREVLEFESDFRVGGHERTQSRLGANTPFPGTSLTNHTVYQDIVPNQRIVFAYTMSLGDHRMSAALVTVQLTPANDGTAFTFTEQGAFFEGSDGPQRREAGWSKLLDGICAELSR